MLVVLLCQLCAAQHAVLPDDGVNIRVPQNLRQNTRIRAMRQQRLREVMTERVRQDPVA